jgi:peptidyl-prolyl cis-trans isomerase SurA
MKKLLTVFCVMGFFAAPAQTLFTYGKQAVSANEFLRAFQKNNNGTTGEKAMREYLDLYIASRLKIAEAKEKKLDTLAQLKTDLAALRQQILPTYLNDKESLDGLVKEAFARQQKDLHVAHIFIAFTKNNVTDTVAAAAKRNDVLERLSKGLAFNEAARQYSDDPSAVNNGGDLGWITAFTLPYELESVVYKTAPGKTSTVYISKAGYHIFKNIGERKALGRVKAAQILLAFPPGADDAYKAGLKKTADSLYNRIVAGDDFGKLATAFSNDVISAASSGQMQEFGVGDYSPVFETTVFALPKDGAISKPFLTEHGYHIVKRIKLLPVSPKLDAATADELRNRLESSDRMQITKTILAQKVLQKTGYKALLSSNNQLWAFTDSVIAYQKPSTKLTLTAATPVLKLGNRTATVKNWIDFAQNHRYRTSGAIKTYPVLWNEFVDATALQYYEDHLEEYNEEFKRQINEFADGNLFFEIMQREVWTPAQTDTVALLNYYKKHRNNYMWKQSADAVLFYAANAENADGFYKALKQSPSSWHTVINGYSEQITSDSGRFELAQIPKGKEDLVGADAVTTPVVNKADNTVSFAYVIGLHNADEPRSFADAKGLVINDYQAELEKAWVTQLKKKYPVVINEKAWKELAQQSHNNAPKGESSAANSPAL